MAPVNDAIANAIVISLPTSFSFDVTGASTAGGPYPAFEDWPDIWYRIEPAADILIGITVEQTGGAAPNGIEVDLYHLTGPDPPTDYNDLDFIDWAGDGTTGPTPDWQDGPTTYLKLTGGEIYYLDVQEYNYVTDDIQGTVTLTSAPPLVNDDWEDAIVINTPGGNSYVASTIGAQLQTGESFGFPHGINDGGSVWYRIVAQDAGPIQLSILHSSGYRLANGYRPRAVVYGPVAYPPANVAAIQGSTIVKTVTDQRNQAGANSSQAPYRASSTWEPWYVEWNATAGQSYYVRVTNESSWEREGTFDLRVTIPNYTTFTATSFMSGSGTVSNVAGWVRETQFRTPTDHDEWKGELDYIETLVISPGLTGDYALELHGRFGYTGGTAQHDLYVAVVKVNGVPVREGIQLNIFDNTTAGYISLTHDYCIGDAGAGSFGTVFARTTLPGQNGGGPRHLRLAAGDEVTIHLGSGFRAFEGPAAGNPTRYIEVDEIRFSPAGSYGDGTPTGWKLIKEEAEQGFSISQGVGMPGRAFGDELFILTDVDPGNANEFGGSAGRRGRTKFGVWRYQLVGGEITAPDLDLNLGASGGELMDIRLFPGDTSLVPFLRDLTILPNGDIYCLWTDGGQYLVMKKWDGAAWSLISDDVGGYGAPYSGWEINHVSMDNDGTDIYLVYGKNVTNGVFTWGAGNGFEWHCQFYDVSADTFTELGTGQTAFPASVLGTRSGDFDHPPRVKVSPGGVPWVIWCEWDPDVGFPYEEYLWVYYWDGGAWVDAEMPHPTVPPPTIANSDYAAGTLASPKGNYVNLLVLESYCYDLVFCHHDGPSETPSVIHQFGWADQFTIPAGTHPGDTVGLFYAECNGVADWDHDFFAYPGTDWGKEYGGTNPRLWMSTDTFSGNLFLPSIGGWDQGLWLDIYSDRPILFTQSGYFGQGVNGIVVLTLNAAGDTWSMLGPGQATETTIPDPMIPASWSDFAQPGCVVNGTPVAWWLDPWTQEEGWWLAAFQAGGVVSMNWRSGDRRGSANRVLVGN